MFLFARSRADKGERNTEMFATCLSDLDLQRFQKISGFALVAVFCCVGTIFLDVQQGRAFEQVSPKITRTKFTMVGGRMSDCDTRDRRQ